MNGKAPPVSELIGLIYETAEDPELWPTLLAGLAGVVEASEGAAVKALVSIEEGAEGRADGEMLDELLPHFERALRLHGRLAESRRRQRAVLGILDRLPLGILSVDEDLRVHAMNRQAETLLSLGLGLRLHGGRVVADTPRRTQALSAQVRQTMEEAVSTPLPLERDAALSVLLTSEEGTGGPGEVPCCTLYYCRAGQGTRRLARGAWRPLRAEPCRGAPHRRTGGRPFAGGGGPPTAYQHPHGAHPAQGGFRQDGHAPPA